MLKITQWSSNEVFCSTFNSSQTESQRGSQVGTTGKQPATTVQRSCWAGKHFWGQNWTDIKIDRTKYLGQYRRE